MNDTVGPTPSAPAPSTPAPSTPPTPVSQEALNVLTAPDDITEFAEERAVQEGRAEQEESEPKRRANHVQRLKRARDRERAEKEALQAQIAGPRNVDGSPEHLEQAAEQTAADADGQQASPPEGYVGTPEEQEYVRQHIAQQAASEIKSSGVWEHKHAEYAAQNPGYTERVTTFFQNEPPPPRYISEMLVSFPTLLTLSTSLRKHQRNGGMGRVPQHAALGRRAFSGAVQGAH